MRNIQCELFNNTKIFSRVGNLAFLSPNNSILAFFISCLALKKVFGLLALFWLFHRVTKFK